MAKSWIENESSITCENSLLARGFLQIPAIVFADDELSPGAKIIYGGLLWYLWRSQDYPGHEQAAEDWGMGRQSVIRHLQELAERGLVVTERPGLGQPNRYHITDPAEAITGFSRSTKKCTSASPE